MLLFICFIKIETINEIINYQFLPTIPYGMNIGGYSHGTNFYRYK